MSNFYISGVRLESMTKKQAIIRIRTKLQNRYGTRIFTPNTLMLYKASKDKRLASLLNGADMLLCDGVGVTLLLKRKGAKNSERITGIDSARWVLGYAAENRLSVYLLGGKPHVAERAAKNLKAALPELNIAGTHDGYFDASPRSAENRHVLRDIRRSRADIVFVCMGFPRQEAWITRYAEQLGDVRLFMALGGSLDVWAGNVRRAPRLFRACGLEWLWRAAKEPHRIKELLSLPVFLIKEIN
jgi:N-acetylglucosaminyldiphosphoundecaprenol N-acetyl-beta-D-mannosaminyltransferase